MSRLTVWGYNIEWPDMVGASRRVVGRFVKPAGATEEHPLGPPPVTETSMSKDPHRVELRHDFPFTLSFWKPDETVGRLRKLMHAEGITDWDGARINIAYPHKNPDVFPGHFDGARQSAVEMRKVGREHAPGIEWRIAEEIVENRTLGRSEDQSSIHALTVRQKFQLRTPNVDTSPTPFRFKNPNTGKPELFVIVDDCIEQGTTMANLLSYIEKNGGKVVAAVAAGSMDLPQRRITANGHLHFDNKGSKFFDAGRNSGRLPQLAHSFSKAAKRDGLKITPQKCIDIFEGRLNLFGNTVFAMTDGECERLVETMNRGGHYGKQMSFKDLIKKLDDNLQAHAAREAAQAVVDAAAANPAAAKPAANAPDKDPHARKVTVRLPPAMY